MARKVSDKYKVDYHVIEVIYFAPGQLPSGDNFAAMWSATRLFGKHQAVGAFWRSGKEIPTTLPRFELGSLELVEPLLAASQAPIFGGGTVAQKNVARDGTLDSDFYYAVTDASKWQVGDTMPTMLMSVSGQWFEKTGVDSVLNTLKAHLSVADRCSPPYALIDLSRPEDAYAGMAYVSTFFQNIPLHRWVEQGNWVYSASKKGDRVRNIYWGNYFGRGILTRLGGREKFIRGYRERAKLKDGTPNAHIWEFANGVFVSLCLDPLGCKPGVPLDFSAMFNLQWLHKELGSNGALCGWAANLPNISDSSTETTMKVVDAPNEKAETPIGFQTFSRLNDVEVQWIGDCVGQARFIVEKYLGPNASVSLNPVTLDRAYGCWLAQWQSGLESEAPNIVVNCIGAAFGQLLVDKLGMEWAVVSDVNGTEMSVSFGPPASRVLVFPTHVVAKRLQTRETGFIKKIFDATFAQINGVKR